MYLPTQLIQCFKYKTGDGVVKYKLTYLVVVRKFMLFHRLALKEDDLFIRLLSPSNHHFITMLDFGWLSPNSLQTEMYSRRAEEQVYSTTVFHPTWRQSLTCLRCAQRQCARGTAFISTDVISNSDTLFRFLIADFLLLLFFLFEVFPYRL